MNRDTNSVNNTSAIGSKWEETEQGLFTPAEIAASERRAAIIAAMTRSRKEQGISQKRLETLSGVKQPIIARMEMGRTSPQIDTLLKILAPLGLTLSVVPLDEQ